MDRSITEERITMKTFIIEREVPGAAKLTLAELAEIRGPPTRPSSPWGPLRRQDVRRRRQALPSTRPRPTRSCGSTHAAADSRPTSWWRSSPSSARRRR